LALLKIYIELTFGPISLFFNILHIGKLCPILGAIFGKSI